MIMVADVASTDHAGILDYTPATNANLNVDDTLTPSPVPSTVSSVSTSTHISKPDLARAGNQYYVVGYKGTSPYDGGLFYCPYVPLQMVQPSVRTPSSQKSASRLVTVLLLTQSLKVPHKVSADSVLTPTATTEELQLRTSCDPSLEIVIKGTFGSSFFMP